MGYIEQTKLVNEFINFLRSSDILTTTQRSVTTVSEDFTTTETGAETITLDKVTVKNIRSVVYNGATLTYGTDYTYDIDNATVTISNVVPDKTVTVSYDYGTDHVHPDFPRMDLTISSFPRVGFGVYGFKSSLAGFGNVLKSNWRFDVRVYGTSAEQTDELIDALRTAVIDARNSLYYCSYIYPGQVLDLSYYETEKGNNKIYVKSIDVFSENNYEIN
jgi:hypothetical protein